MIKVISVNEDNSYDSNVHISGDGKEILIELALLFEIFINSDCPEVIHAVFSHYLPKLTDQLDEDSIDKNLLLKFINVLEVMETK